jgi:DNA helicase II / ATP-dependent DNA helicase PcrA
VAITRAEKKLFMSYALQRYRFGNLRMCEPSRFLDEIDNQYLISRSNRPSTRAENTFTSFGKPLVRTAEDFSVSKPAVKTYPTQTPKSQGEHKPSPNFVASNPAKLREGMKVEHQKFGFGRVLKIDMQGTDKRATILFENSGEKTLLLSFAKLMIVE